jgi:hypothetical protein
MFKFKHFSVSQDLCAMKVGTDGVLLGAWANGGDSILDVGTGTGLIALMISFAAFCGADPIEGVPVINACCLAFLAGFLMLALLLAGSSIVLRQAYNLKTLGYSVAGAVIGTLLAYLFTLI